jgi:hypothetical protein
MGLKNYRGFAISWAEPPTSTAMWGLEIGTDDPDLRKSLAQYRAKAGPFATPVGPLENALAAAEMYIDDALANP